VTERGQVPSAVQPVPTAVHLSTPIARYLTTKASRGASTIDLAALVAVQPA
jgi:hypothetical protein